jgi:DNA replication regulator SLD2
VRPVSKIQVQESQPAPQRCDDESEQSDNEHEELIAETQDLPTQTGLENEDIDHDDDSDAFSNKIDEEALTVKRAKVSKTGKGTITKPTKKRVVKPEAHANYVKLKIKNQNTKGNKGKGRFGRKNR